MNDELEKRALEFFKPFGLHPNLEPLIYGHSVMPITDNDMKLGSALAYLVPSEDWTRIVYALRAHGLMITDARCATYVSSDDPTIHVCRNCGGALAAHFAAHFNR